MRLCHCFPIGKLSPGDPRFAYARLSRFWDGCSCVVRPRFRDLGPCACRDRGLFSFVVVSCIGIHKGPRVNPGLPEYFSENIAPSCLNLDVYEFT